MTKHHQFAVSVPKPGPLSLACRFSLPELHVSSATSFVNTPCGPGTALPPVKMLDLDSENKARGSLAHFFGSRVPKVDIHTPAGLGAYVDHLADGAPVILVGAGSGQVTSSHQCRFPFMVVGVDCCRAMVLFFGYTS
jgi:hypothetical protein